MRMTRWIVMLVLLLAVADVGVTRAESEKSQGVEAELADLVDTVAQLVRVLELNAAASEDNSLRRIEIAVRLLDIRAREQLALRSELTNVLDWEQTTQGFVDATNTRLENLDNESAAAVDAASKLAIGGKRASINANNKTHRKKLEYLRSRRIEIENSLSRGARSVDDLEVLIQEWLSGD